jgi:hypothetical protein
MHKVVRLELDTFQILRGQEQISDTRTNMRDKSTSMTTTRAKKISR